MKTSYLKLCGFATATALAISCSQPEVQPDLDRAQALLHASTGAEGSLQLHPDPLSADAIQAILADGLSLEEAMQLTLRNNQDLQVAMLEIGIAQADLLQAGLLSNPTLDLAVRFPGDGTGDLIEGLLGMELMQLWQIPARKRAAGLELETVVAQVARTVGNQLLETRRSYWILQNQTQRQMVAELDLEVAKQIHRSIKDLFDFGSADQAVLDAAHLEETHARTQLQKFESESADALRALAKSMSLGIALTDLELTDALPELTQPNLYVEDLVTHALENRLDLSSLRSKVGALEAELEAQRRGTMGALSVGASAEKPEGESRSLGPAISWTLPLFDRNQAGIAKAEFALAQAEHQEEGAKASVAQEVRWSFGRWMMAQEASRLHYDEFLPLAWAAVKRIEQEHELGTASQLQRLTVGRKAMALESEGVELHLQEILRARELERAVGKPLFEDVALEWKKP